jgi:quaternary ammonium compound-resistance protein SugE
MAWVYIIIAGIFEVTWAVGLKYSLGFTRLWPSLGTAIAMLASIYFLNVAVKTLPVGTAYAVWTGIGAVGTALMGIILFDEPKAVVRLLCIMLVVVGVVGLKFTSSQ